ncbi:MAG: copper chaperone PCu(A)C [Mesorhizobium sp.]|uniref:copper chaperone PCu(A)C n=1 Tax=Mesorhizobium sp. TaxID=1871066 RepID=UPI000FE9D3A5|nr:copper chaperone PCu(A)C [Mesorhizobium sp.]RWL78616.1 MAG: copper chaperone PCu(A)C [Mesorhizobium sp.]RWL82949.1 MAG: copper chaperone PCu(A)C [Mesorhizobium sp.]RWL93834.1 MAG: copper chaperone PCu(A)C [Mesorhizobium sp.]TIP03765.1 MAG: copper chaperone PCu(A)C [Mesorhizobium sp.]
MSNLLCTARTYALRATPPSLFQQRVGFAILSLLLLLACIPGALAHGFKVGDLEIEHPWSRATPPGAKVAGGYFTVVNKGSASDRLLSISSDISDKAELHEMGVKDGVMIMRPVEGGLEIPAGGKVALKPGAYHLMFTGLKRQPKQGEKFPATLTFEKAGTVKVEFAVEGMGETDSGDMDMDHAE